MNEDSLYNQFYRTAEKYPDHIALSFENREFTYQELNRWILDCAERLESLNIHKGDVITTCLPNCPLSVTLFYAIDLLGAISYHIHPMTSIENLHRMMEEAGSDILFTLGLDQNALRKEFDKDTKIILVNPYHRINPVKSILFRMKTSFFPAFETYKSLKKGKEPTPVLKTPQEDSVYLNTGGTNGKPKIVRLSAQSINYLASQGYQLIQGPVEDIKILTAIPLFHGFGLGMGVHTPLSIGSTSVLMLKFHTKDAIRLIQKGKVSVIIGVPALYNALLSKKNFYGPFLKKQLISFIGGDNVPESLIDRWNKAMEDKGSEARLYEGYGLTETVTCLSVNTRFGRSRIGSIGKPLPGIEVRIIDPETSKEKRLGEEGEIIVSSPTLMNGYLNQDRESESPLFTHDGKTFLKTKDIGYLDQDGYLYFRHRMKRIVKINGESICPNEVEDLILQDEDIYEAYCYGVKDERKGHHLRLALVIKEDSKKTEEEIRKTLSDKIHKNLRDCYMPDRFDFYKELPHTPVGKIDIAAFREDDKD